MDDQRGLTFLDYLTDLLAFGIVALFLLVVTHSLGLLSSAGPARSLSQR